MGVVGFDSPAMMPRRSRGGMASVSVGFAHGAAFDRAGGLVECSKSSIAKVESSPGSAALGRAGDEGERGEPSRGSRRGEGMSIPLAISSGEGAVKDAGRATSAGDSLGERVGNFQRRRPVAGLARSRSWRKSMCLAR
jgi:hypothetical protein